MSALDDLIAANRALQNSTAAAKVTKDFAAKVTAWAKTVTPGPVPAGATYLTLPAFTAGIPSPWQPSQFFPTGTKPPAVVPDPLGQHGTVLLLEVDYASSLPTDYTSAALQQTAISINPQYARAGMDANGGLAYGMDTWYGFRVMAPAGNVFCNGESDWLSENHDTTGGAGPKSSGLFAYGGFPLTAAGTSSAHFVYRETVDTGGGTYTNLYFPGAVASPDEAVADGAPAFTLGVWHDVLIHKVWSPDPSIGLSEGWIDGKQVWSRHLQTQAVADYYSWAVYNYRYNVTGASRLYYAARSNA